MTLRFAATVKLIHRSPWPSKLRHDFEIRRNRQVNSTLEVAVKTATDFGVRRNRQVNSPLAVAVKTAT